MPVPVTVPPHTSIAEISAGCFTDVALTSTGRVLQWGRRLCDQASGSAGLTSHGIVLTWNATSLTDDDPNPAPPVVPVKVLIPPNIKVTEITADGPALEGTTYYALTSNGQVYAWGSDLAGALGDGGGPDTNVPLRVEIPVGLTPTVITAGGYEPTPFAFAVTRP